MISRQLHGLASLYRVVETIEDYEVSGPVSLLTTVKAQTTMVYSSFSRKKERNKNSKKPFSLEIPSFQRILSLSLLLCTFLSSPFSFVHFLLFPLSLSLSHNLTPHLSLLSLDDLLSLTANSLGFPLSLPIHPWRHKSNKVLSLSLSLFDRFDSKKIVRCCILTL